MSKEGAPKTLHHDEKQIEVQKKQNKGLVDDLIKLLGIERPTSNGDEVLGRFVDLNVVVRLHEPQLLWI